MANYLPVRLEEDVQAFQESEEASKAMADVPNDDAAFSSRRQSRVSPVAHLEDFGNRGRVNLLHFHQVVGAQYRITQLFGVQRQEIQEDCFPILCTCLPDGGARIFIFCNTFFLPPVYHGARIQTHVSRVVPDWDL